MRAFEYARALVYAKDGPPFRAVGTYDPSIPFSLGVEDGKYATIVDGSTIERSTGLVDSEGNDIFTGDLLTLGTAYRAEGGYVVFDHEQAAFFIRAAPRKHVDETADAITVTITTVNRRLNQRVAKLYTIREETENE